jgi:hypothetical protein
MTKDDKQYLTKLFKGLEGRFDTLEDQVARNYVAIQKNSADIKRLDEGVRHNGVLIEKLQDNIDLILEGNSSFHGRISRLEKAVL